MLAADYDVRTREGESRKAEEEGFGSSFILHPSSFVVWGGKAVPEENQGRERIDRVRKAVGNEVCL